MRFSRCMCHLPNTQRRTFSHTENVYIFPFKKANPWQPLMSRSTVFIYFNMQFCCFGPSHFLFHRIISSQSYMAFNKADILLFDVCQSKWTINAKYNHSFMLMILWGSLMAPVVSVKCVWKCFIRKAIQTASIKPHSVPLPFQQTEQNLWIWKKVHCSGENQA